MLTSIVAEVRHFVASRKPDVGWGRLRTSEPVSRSARTASPARTHNASVNRPRLQLQNAADSRPRRVRARSQRADGSRASARQIRQRRADPLGDRLFDQRGGKFRLALARRRAGLGHLRAGLARAEDAQGKRRFHRSEAIRRPWRRDPLGQREHCLTQQRGRLLGLTERLSS